jgi:hypothetical protein
MIGGQVNRWTRGFGRNAIKLRKSGKMNDIGVQIFKWGRI